MTDLGFGEAMIGSRSSRGLPGAAGADLSCRTIVLGNAS